MSDTSATSTAAAVTSVISGTVDKLGTALGNAVHALTPFAQEIFAIYVRQQIAIGLAFIVGAAICAVALIFALRASVWGIKQPKDYFIYSSIKTYDTAAQVAMGIGIPVSVVSALLFVIFTVQGVLHLTSPAYYAIQAILTQLHGGSS